MRAQWSQTATMVSVDKKLLKWELTIPHSKPSNISPTKRTSLLGAKKTMNRKQVITQRVQRTTFFGPKAATSQPLIKVPKIEPTPNLLVESA
jgi:hypothetical protein